MIAPEANNGKGLREIWGDHGFVNGIILLPYFGQRAAKPGLMMASVVTSGPVWRALVSSAPQPPRVQTDRAGCFACGSIPQRSRAGLTAGPFFMRGRAPVVPREGEASSIPNVGDCSPATKLLDHPLEPANGPAKGRTRWRMLTASACYCSAICAAPSISLGALAAPLCTTTAAESMPLFWTSFTGTSNVSARPVQSPSLIQRRTTLV